MSYRLFALLPLWFLLVCCDHKQVSPPSPRERNNAEPNPPRLRRDATSVPPEGSLAAARKELDQALEIDEPMAREKAIASFAWSNLESEPELAVEAFKLLPSGSSEKIRLIQHYALRAAEEDMDEVIAWAASLESEQERSAAYSQIALAMAETDPEGAAKLLAESGKPGRELDVAVVQVVQRWAAQKPADAAAWLAMFPSGPAREAGIKTVAGRWLPVDAKEAFAWLSTLQDPTVRQEAALGLQEAILQQPEDIRDSWLQHASESIRSELEKQRERAIKEVGDNIPHFQKESEH